MATSFALLFFRYGLIIPSKNKGVRTGFLSNTSESKKVSQAFAAESSSDDNLEEDEEEGKPAALDWRSRTVAVCLSHLYINSRLGLSITLSFTENC